MQLVAGCRMDVALCRGCCTSEQHWAPSAAFDAIGLGRSGGCATTAAAVAPKPPHCAVLQKAAGEGCGWTMRSEELQLTSLLPFAIPMATSTAHPCRPLLHQETSPGFGCGAHLQSLCPSCCCCCCCWLLASCCHRERMMHCAVVWWRWRSASEFEKSDIAAVADSRHHYGQWAMPCAH